MWDKLGAAVKFQSWEGAELTRGSCEDVVSVFIFFSFPPKPLMGIRKESTCMTQWTGLALWTVHGARDHNSAC